MSQPAAEAAPLPRQRTITLISKDNGAGLTIDMQLLDHFLTEAGYQVRMTDWRAKSMPLTDIAIFLELYSPLLARYAHHTIGIFNAEWFMPYWRRHLPNITQLWCKSRQIQEMFDRYGLTTKHYTGFLSRYLHDPDVPRERRVLHLQGRSMLKNTPAVIEAWRRYPDLPPLTIIAADPLPAPPHVTVHSRVSNEDLGHLLNSHRFHLCPSRAEGWGHYITEGLSTGAHVITTDASPMNEHVDTRWGSLIQPTGSIKRLDVREYQVDPERIAAAVRQADALTDQELDEQGEMARTHFLLRNDAFRTTALKLLEQL